MRAWMVAAAVVVSSCDGSSGSSALAECIEAYEVIGEPGTAQRLAFSAEGIAIVLALEPINPMNAGGDTVPWELTRFAVEYEGEVHCVTSEDALEYEVGHHNWNDYARASAGGRDFEIHMLYAPVGDPPFEYVDTLRIDEGEGIVLDFEGCWSMEEGSAWTPSGCPPRS